MKDKNKLLIVQNVRISEELEMKLSDVSDRLELAKQDVIRLCLRIGLGHLERVKYDLAKCVLDASGKAKK